LKYLVFYKVNDAEHTIVIHRILHGTCDLVRHLLALFTPSDYTVNMLYEQTITVPENHRLTLEVPHEIPAGAVARFEIVWQTPSPVLAEKKRLEVLSARRGSLYPRLKNVCKMRKRNMPHVKQAATIR
jgi:hypothetical protein